jgi:RimJ/RimL family protein N-acetyltransferase
VIAVPEADVMLKDGTPVHIRPIRPEDDHALVEVFHRLSPETVYQRFFAALPELPPDMAQHLANVNFKDRFALVAEVDGKPIGVGRYERSNDSDRVELGLVVVDEWQGRGLGRILLRETLRAAAANGIHRFRADVLAENRRMLHLLAEEMEIEQRKTQASVTTLLLRSK